MDKSNIKQIADEATYRQPQKVVERLHFHPNGSLMN